MRIVSMSLGLCGCLGVWTGFESSIMGQGKDEPVGSGRIGCFCMSCTFFFLCFAVGEEEVWIEARYWEWEALTNNRYHHLNHYAILGVV